MNSIFSIAITFFLVTNPIGNSPAILALVKDFDFKRQKRIMLRETLFALLIALFFQYLGEPFLNLLHIKNYAVTLCGGTLLFLVALNMIFPTPESNDTVSNKQEPFFVPIATPLLSGPGLLTIIMLKSQLEQNNLTITLAILVAWIGVALVMILAPYLQIALGKKGMIALEQLMGLLLAMIATDMLVTGASLFREQLST
jgi:multiple antibiotic resistance protein